MELLAVFILPCGLAYFVDRMKKLLFITDANHPRLQPGDTVLAKVFHEHGYQVLPFPWDGPSPLPLPGSTLLFRSCWNYHMHIKAFTDWLADLKKNNIRTHNSLALVEWNLHKHYLLELGNKRVNIIPTRILTDAYSLQDMLHETGWADFVIKPSVGATSIGFERFSLETIKQALHHIEHLLLSSSVLVQPYITGTEYRMVYINRTFSHGLVNIGNRFSLTSDLPGEMVLAGKQVLELIEGPLLYARVDMLLDGNQFRLLEVELIEPTLYFDLYPPSALTFVQAFNEISA
jgi:hypothetical protein